MSYTRPGDIAFMIGCFEGDEAGEILQFGEGMNQKFVFIPPKLPGRGQVAWRGQLPTEVQVHSPVFSFPFREKTRRAGCWVLGSDTKLNEIDFKVAKSNRQAVSKKCIKIDFVTHLTGYPILRITNLSDVAKLFIEHGEGASLHLARGDSDEINKPVVVHHPRFTFRIWSPKRSRPQQMRFRSHVQKMHERAITEPPEYWPPLDSGLATVDEDTRTSKDGTVFTKLPMLRQDSGATCSVFSVRKLGPEGVTLCAKQLVRGERESSKVIKTKNDKIENEFQSYRRFSHPHLATVVDIAYIRHDVAPPWLILEYVPFGLGDFLQGKIRWPESPLPPIDPVDIIMQLASFLGWLHREDAVHRDLSPANVRLYPDTERWVVKVIDLGELQSVADVRGLVGTPYFVAPEILKHSCGNEKVDMFSLGVIAFYLFTKVKLRYNPEEETKYMSPEYQARWMRLTVVPKLQEQVDEKFRPLLGGLLALKAENRWSAQKVLNFLWQVSDETRSSSRKRSATPVAYRDIKRRRESETSTIRPPRVSAVSDSSSTTGSFVTAKEYQNDDCSYDGLPSFPASPFVDYHDFNVEAAGDMHLSPKIEYVLGTSCMPDEEDWNFTFTLDDWYNGPRDKEVYPDVGEPQTGLTHNVESSQFGPSCAAGVDSEAETVILPLNRAQTGLTHNVESSQFGPSCAAGADSEAETVILPLNRAQSGLTGTHSLIMRQPAPSSLLIPDTRTLHVPHYITRTESSISTQETALDGVVSCGSSIISGNARTFQ
ncbi:Serine/threonine-protein kinase DCLK3 [Cytospora mali]|uniref:Serine/threonine-protein kinase DCLK3 n=1 Tax=Cytospora mali TaxID=578113 RepID=A0A194VH24_CYTMA|nr:Serine/threonine-protein kinase DCLK3 [Valsa mali]